MDNTQLLDYLTCDFDKTIRDPLWKDIRLSEGFWQLYATPQFQKLDRIRQLGPTALVYPGAVHTRLSHSLGVFHLSRQMIISLLSKGYSHFTKCGIDSFLCAAMLHDLGHFPYAHSLKEVITRDHEELGAVQITQSPRILAAIKSIGADPSWVCAIIDSSMKAPSDEVVLFRNMLSCTLDPDKLDYLCRDAFYCGVPYGVQDVSYIIEQIDITKTELSLRSQSMSSIEHLLFAKYLMYKNVYWNRHVRCATAMIKTAIIDALNAGFLHEDDLFGLDDYEFILLCRKKNIPRLDLIRRVWENDLLDEIKACPADEEIVLDENQKSHSIIDIPEPISFESNLLISDLNKTFIECDSVFNTQTIGGFSKSLRMARVFSDKGSKNNG